MKTETKVAAHYDKAGLLDRIKARLQADGVAPADYSCETLAPYDQFHGRGLEATVDIADNLSVSPAHRILDVGSGIGGPARYMATRFGCRVDGIDLTEAFCSAARDLNQLLGLSDTVRIHHGSALAMPYQDATFDGAYSMNVSMNIANRTGFHREVHRVLKPGAWFALSEITLGRGGPVTYPTPWAASAETSYLVTVEETCAGLRDQGFEIVTLRDTSKQAETFAKRAREAAKRGEKPAMQAIYVIHDAEEAQQIVANTAANARAHRTVPVEIFCRKTG